MPEREPQHGAGEVDAIAGARSVTDEFLATFNAGDAAAHAATLAYPHVRLASGTVRVWATFEEAHAAMTVAMPRAARARGLGPQRVGPPRHHPRGPGQGAPRRAVHPVPVRRVGDRRLSRGLRDRRAGRRVAHPVPVELRAVTGDAVPRVDVGALVTGRGDTAAVARAIDTACRETGFFSIVNHGVDARAARAPGSRGARVLRARRRREVRGSRWCTAGAPGGDGSPSAGSSRPEFPTGRRASTSGPSSTPDDPRVRAGLPLHGPNQFPRRPSGLRDTVLEYLEAMRTLSQDVMRGVALGLGLDADWFARELTRDPVVLFRIFHYPPASEPAHRDAWGVGEHTDYGLLTVLLQDATGGLQVRTPSGWIDVPADPDAFVCNVGDMLERMTGGRYRSTPHRARNPGAHGRLSFPFFFDPGWDAEVHAVPDVAGDSPAPDSPPRWDDADVHELSGTYGEYLLTKVGRVFPDLRDDVLEPRSPDRG